MSSSNFHYMDKDQEIINRIIEEWCIENEKNRENMKGIINTAIMEIPELNNVLSIYIDDIHCNKDLIEITHNVINLLKAFLIGTKCKDKDLVVGNLICSLKEQL